MDEMPQPERWETHREPPPHDDLTWTYLLALIRNNATDEVREYRALTVIDEVMGWPNDFIWAEGNYSCDCNRELFFARAAGHEAETTECTDWRFSVNLLHPTSRTCFYREFEDA